MEQTSIQCKNTVCSQTQHIATTECRWPKTCAIGSGHILVLRERSGANNPPNPQQTGNTAISTNGADNKGCGTT
eukprot:2564750-Ditylum_brightwellii.AAC.1